MSCGLIRPRALAALLLVSCGGGVALPARPSAQTLPASASHIAASAEVRVDNFSFSPAMLIVTVGTTVTWVNGDDIPHTIVANNRAFRSKTLDTEDQFSFTFSTAGEFEYFCSLHPHMVGKIIVSEGNSPS